jgi:hypothetical protein
MGGARGYLIYEVSIFLYAALGAGFARLAGTAGPVRKALAALLLVPLLAGHAVWNTEHLRGHTGPVQVYFVGFSSTPPRLVLDRPLVSSMTGAEPTPVTFGGDATLAEAGFTTDPRRRDQDPSSALYAIGARAYFLLYGVPIVLLLAPDRERRRRWLKIALGAFVASACLSAWAPRWGPRVNSLDEAISIPAGGTLRYTVPLSEPFAKALSAPLSPGETFEVFCHLHASPRAPRIFLGDRELALVPEEQHRWSVSAEPLLVALARSRELTVRIEAGEKPLSVLGWQRTDLARRTLEGPPGAKVPVLPAFELRRRKGNGLLALAGF